MLKAILQKQLDRKKRFKNAKNFSIGVYNEPESAEVNFGN